MNKFVSVSSDLPVSAESAFVAAQKMQTMQYVMWPVFGMRVDAASIDRVLAEPRDGGLPIGVELSARLVLFGAVPLWKHKMTIVRNGDLEIYTNEVSGPVRIWNHRLTFRPTGHESCHYTDEVEIEGGVRGAGNALFIKVFFHHRHRRWQRLLAHLNSNT